MNKTITSMMAFVFLTACAPLQNQVKEKRQEAPQTTGYRQGKVFTPTLTSPPKSDVLDVNQEEQLDASNKSEIYKGNGKFLKLNNKKVQASTSEETVSLDWVDQDIQTAMKTVFDVLEKKYWVDPRVTGKITFNASIPISALMPAMEAVLRLSDVVIVNGDGVFKVVPLAAAQRGLNVPGRNRAGYRAQVFALQYITASEMAKIVTNAAEKSSVITDDIRNFLIVSGTGPELAQVAESVKIFDVDWLSGMSVAMLTIENTDTKSIAEEINHIIDKDKNPNAALIRILPIERLNALLVITPQPSYLDQISAWVRRLDQPGNQAGERLYVYYVQNGKAAELADILNQVLGDEGTNARAQPNIINAPVTQDVSATGQLPQTSTAGIQLNSQSNIRLIADEINNALLIKADHAGYRLVRDALLKLDITPLQVLIEVTIAEVILNNDLQYGVEWFFRNSVGGKQGEGLLDLGLAGIGNPFNGFQYTLRQGDSVRAVIELLEDESDVKILSSPSIMVLNNQTAQIEIGDEVPILTQQSTSASSDADNPFVVNSVEYKQTGILLNVTPRVNISGLVTMEVVQEVSDVVNTQSSQIDSPTITQRKIETLVAVNSEQTVILGGLISEQNSETRAGIPFLKDAPIIGPLFGQTITETERSELMIMITPHVIQNGDRARQLTDEFRRKMKGLDVFNL